jgi:hypothetical protein
MRTNFFALFGLLHARIEQQALYLGADSTTIAIGISGR